LVSETEQPAEQIIDMYIFCLHRLFFFPCSSDILRSFFDRPKNEPKKGATNGKSIISFTLQAMPELGPDMIDFAPFVVLPARRNV